MSEKRSCGKHVDLATNGSVKITQCPCGTLHVTLNASGVTVRMTEETFKAATSAFLAATDKVTGSAENVPTGVN
jgi:hypothetical protein